MFYVFISYNSLQILWFTSDFTWDVSLAGNFIGENSLEIF